MLCGKPVKHCVQRRLLKDFRSVFIANVILPTSHLLHGVCTCPPHIWCVGIGSGILAIVNSFGKELDPRAAVFKISGS